MRLLVLGDWGRRGAPGQRSVARAMAKVARDLPVDAVVSTGDNFYEDGVASVRDAHWRESFEDVYDDPALLQVPWWICLGNHDNRGSATAQMAYSALNPRWHLPERWHALHRPVDAATGAHLIFLDTSLMLPRHRSGGEAELAGLAGVDPQDQLRWLERTLADSSADWKIVVGHHPIVSGSPCHGSSPELHRQLLPVLERYGVSLYLAGHEHDLQHLVTGDLQCVVSGAGAELRETGRLPESRFAASTLGFVLAEVARHRIALRFFDDRGAVLYDSEICRPESALPRAAQA